MAISRRSITPACPVGIPLSDLKAGDAVMVVASEPTSRATANVTAVTLLSGVEPILAATPTGSARHDAIAMERSPPALPGAAANDFPPPFPQPCMQLYLPEE